VQAECFVYRNEQDVLIYPYLRTHINAVVDFICPEDCYDIEGAYGYNGFGTTSHELKFLQSFRSAFGEYCRQQNIIAEFTRFNPTFKNYALALDMDVELMNRNVIVDLKQSENDLWMKSYEHSVRKNVNKAKRQGVEVESFLGAYLPPEKLKEFLRVYKETMDKNKAEGFYYFNQKYFEDICKHLGQESLFMMAMLEGQVISCELVLLSSQTAYSFLGGTLADYYKLGANNLLKHELILKLKSMGLTSFCIGGGRSINDDIFRYKRNFAKDGVVDFFVGTKVHHQETYAKLCSLWEKQFPEKSQIYKNYFLKYRN
jgi:hypothetical protein